MNATPNRFDRSTAAASASVLFLTISAACGAREVDLRPTGRAAQDAGAGDAGTALDAGIPVGPERDLVPFARLYASDTQPKGGVPWPREAEDAIATIRDDDPETGWKAPVGKKSSVSIDIQPWLGRSVALTTLSAAFTGTPPEKVTVELADGCGGEETRRLEWKAFPAALDLGGATAGCVDISFNTKAAMSLAGLSLTTNDGLASSGFGIRDWRSGARRLRTQDSGLRARSGVVEGFYGAPWSWRERAHMIETMSALGLGAYVYGPKLDPKHRERWREAYSQAEIDSFADLNAFAGAEGVRSYFGISPFIDFDGRDDSDYATLKSKIETMISAGVKGVVVMADDIEFAASVEVGAELAAIHVGVTNRLLGDVRLVEPAIDAWFVGTVYSDERTNAWEGGRAYLEGLSALDPAIGIMWTGPGTSSATMKGTDLEAVTTATGRRPIIWDNYWANDGGDGFQGRLLLGPFFGRGPDLLPAVEGICHNPMIQGSLSRLVLGAFGAWLADPTLTDADAARARAASIESMHLLPGNPEIPNPKSQTDVLSLVMSVFNGGAMGESRYVEMESAVDALSAGMETGQAIPILEAAAALRIFARMSTLRSEVRHSLLDPDLVDELEFPLEKVAHDGQAGLFAAAALGARLSGRDGSEYASEYQRASLRSAENRFVYSAGAIDAFYRDVGRVGAVDRGFAAPAIFAPGACKTGKALVWNAAEAGAAVEVLGLPGAVVEGTGVKWTPPHSGTWDAAIIATTDKGWAFSLVSLVCEG